MSFGRLMNVSKEIFYTLYDSVLSCLLNSIKRIKNVILSLNVSKMSFGRLMNVSKEVFYTLYDSVLSCLLNSIKRIKNVILSFERLKDVFWTFNECIKGSLLYII